MPKIDGRETILQAFEIFSIFQLMIPFLGRESLIKTSIIFLANYLSFNVFQETQYVIVPHLCHSGEVSSDNENTSDPRNKK